MMRYLLYIRYITVKITPSVMENLISRPPPPPPLTLNGVHGGGHGPNLASTAKTPDSGAPERASDRDSSDTPHSENPVRCLGPADPGPSRAISTRQGISRANQPPISSSGLRPAHTCWANPSPGILIAAAHQPPPRRGPAARPTPNCYGPGARRLSTQHVRVQGSR